MAQVKLQDIALNYFYSVVYGLIDTSSNYEKRRNPLNWHTFPPQAKWFNLNARLLQLQTSIKITRKRENDLRAALNQNTVEFLSGR